MSRLAIVIPAYKAQYFDSTLLSIAKQTCQDFTVYIGNDCSPEDLKTISDSYQDKIRIVYKKFDSNLGIKDLVAHWERCIDLIEEEEWIWLFSDDDIMDSTCVEDFFKTLTRSPEYDLFHFNILKINEKSELVENCLPFPEVYTSEEFLKKRLKGAINSFVVEYVFRKSHFLNCNRFQNFDLAWASDDATWIKLGKKGGIKTIEKSIVYWRESPFNISTNFRDEYLLKRKLYSQIKFTKWVLEQSKKKEIQIELKQLKKLLELWFLEKIKIAILFLPFRTITKLVSSFCFILDNENNSYKKLMYLYIYKKCLLLKRVLKNVLSYV